MRRSLVSDALLFHGTAQHLSLLARRPLVFSTVAQIKKSSRISHHARCGVAATKLPAPFGGAPAQEKNGFRSGVVFVQDSRSYLNQLLWARCIDPNIARCARSLAPGAQLKCRVLPSPSRRHSCHRPTQVASYQGPKRTPRRADWRAPQRLQCRRWKRPLTANVTCKSGSWIELLHSPSEDRPGRPAPGPLRPDAADRTCDRTELPKTGPGRPQNGTIFTRAITDWCRHGSGASTGSARGAATTGSAGGATTGAAGGATTRSAGGATTGGAAGTPRRTMSPISVMYTGGTPGALGPTAM